MTAPPAIAPSEPCAGPSAIDSVRSSPSGSVQLSGTDTATPTAVRRATSSQAGARVTASVTVAAGPVARPSVAR